MMRSSRAYQAGALVAVLTSLVTLWTTIVRDDGNGIGFFLVIMAAAVGAFAAWFRPTGMARSMAGVAVMQLVLGSLIATAPSTANIPGELRNILLCSAVLSMLWLVSALSFRAAANGRLSGEADVSSSQIP